MPTSAAGTERDRVRAAARGFTLIELLIALLIIAVLASVAALALPRHGSQAARREADRLAALLDTARQQALLSGQPLAWVATPDGYLFVRAAASGWDVLQQSPLQPRRWSWLGEGSAPQLPTMLTTSALRLDGGVELSVSGGVRDPQAGRNWLVFGSEPVQPALALQLDADRVTLRVASDGLHPFQVSEHR